MRLEIKKKLLSKSERVKSVELHPQLPWVLVALYTGNVSIIDYNTQSNVRSFEVSNAPVRTAKFIVRKQWIIVASDDSKIRVYNYNTCQKLKTIEEHTDFIRSMAVHPTLPYVLSCSDDQTIKLYDWDKNWQKINSYEDHDHYIMQVAINPKDTNMFASASLDRFIKIWTITNQKTNANYSLVGHQAGVNCIDFCNQNERPHLVSGGDDGHVKVWDYQSKQCLYTFTDGHKDNVSSVAFHPDLPLIFSAGEDHIINIWNSLTYKQETFLNYGLQRVWAIHALPESNYVAFGFDEATMVIKLGKEMPLASFSNGKVVWVKQSTIQTSNLKLIKEDELKDGEKVKSLNIKDLGHAETFAQQIKFAPNGRFFAVCGDNDFVVYNYPKFQNSSFGQGGDLVWSTLGSHNVFAVRNEHGMVKTYKDFQESKSFKTTYTNEGLFGGRLLGIKSRDLITFYDWEDYNIVRQIELASAPKNVFWSDNGSLTVLALEDTFYLLQYNADIVENTMKQSAMGKVQIDDDGIEDAFTIIEEFSETIISATWIGNDCFVYTNNKGSISYILGNKQLKLVQSEKKYFILGYDQKQSKLYLIDKSLNLTSYTLLLPLIMYQAAVLQEDLQGAQAYFEDIPEAMHSKLAKFLESNGQKEMAYGITPDQDHKFELAISLNRIGDAAKIAEEQENVEKWKKVGDIALMSGVFSLAEECFLKSKDFNSLFLYYSTYGDEEGLKTVSQMAEDEGKLNVAFQASFVVADIERCLNLLIKGKRFADASMFSRAYCPSKANDILETWGKQLKGQGLLFEPQKIEGAELTDAVRQENSLSKNFHQVPKPAASEFLETRKEYYEEVAKDP